MAPEKWARLIFLGYTSKILHRIDTILRLSLSVAGSSRHFAKGSLVRFFISTALTKTKELS